MITNEKQFRATRSLVERLREGLHALDDQVNETLSTDLIDVHRAALSSQIEELEEDLAAYENLRSGKVKEFTAQSLGELPDILIQARIARGMSQKDLADFLGLKEQQIQRYEAERYRSASLDRLVQVSDALGVQIRKRAELTGARDLSSVDPSVWQAFPIAEMFKRGWFEDFAGTMQQARKSAAELIPTFLAGSQSGNLSPVLHRKSVRAAGQVHESALAAWEARIRQLASRNPPEVEFDRDHINEAWLTGLIDLSLDERGPAKVVNYLRDAGIALIVERHLPGTLLDGAAMCALDDYAIVALTLRHDRLDNFWFTLLHEIGHLKYHIGHGEFAAIFDDIDAPPEDDREKQADLFAQEALLPSDKWKLSASRYTRTEKAVMLDSNRFKVSPAIIAGRIRREAGNYTLLKDRVGSGEVRRQFDL